MYAVVIAAQSNVVSELLERTLKQDFDGGGSTGNVLNHPYVTRDTLPWEFRVEQQR